MKLHPKILALRNSIGSTPYKAAHKFTTLVQPEAIRAAAEPEEGDRTLKQYFCIWGIPDDYGTVPIKGCFSKSIKERGPKSNGAYKIPALYMHRQGDTVGLPAILKEDEIGLYAEVPILKGVQVADELIIRHRDKVCNNGSYGFDYVWDKMEYDEKNDVILMKECDLFEISFVTIGSQMETYGVRSFDPNIDNQDLLNETDEFIKHIPRAKQLQFRSLIDKHISLARLKPTSPQKEQSLSTRKPKQAKKIDYNLITKNLTL